MAKRGRGEVVEVIEVPVEALAYVPGASVDRLDAARRWWAAHHSGGSRQPSGPSGLPVPARIDGGTTFRRLVEVPGGRLPAVLGSWWRRAAHGDAHFRLEAPHRVDEAWELSGALRRRAISRWVPVDLRLSPYAGRWCLLEMMPRRLTRPSRAYFRVGHDSLDSFVAAMCAEDALEAAASED
jgi:hypothetical protein